MPLGRVHINYFAYGSNLHVPRLHNRVSSCRVIEIGRLSGHALRFHKRGADGSGKCNVLATGNGKEQVIGVLYRIDAAQQWQLDEAEGVGFGYDVAQVRVAGAQSDYTAFTYIARPSAVEDGLVPWDWYKALVLAGARAHALPGPYVEQIEAQPVLPDPDESRAAEHMGIVNQPYDMAALLA